MAQDPGLSKLLKWSIQNSNPETPEPAPDAARSGLNEEVLRQLMGGPSDADLMKQSMAAIGSDQTSLDDRLVAFDNLEQLIENIDNANIMEPLGLWTPLLAQLDSDIADLRRMAAWCVGTAVQNNPKAQERLLALNGIPKLCEIAVNDQDQKVRKKAVYALSSSIRNYQPGTNEAVKFLPAEIVGTEKVSAGDMDAIDAIMTKLREQQ